MRAVFVEKSKPGKVFRLEVLIVRDREDVVRVVGDAIARRAYAIVATPDELGSGKSENEIRVRVAGLIRKLRARAFKRDHPGSSYEERIDEAEKQRIVDDMYNAIHELRRGGML